LHRAGTPEEIAEAVQFLGLDKASYLTGQVLTIDADSWRAGLLSRSREPWRNERSGSPDIEGRRVTTRKTGQRRRPAVAFRQHWRATAAG
jgi:hypothetical protein